MPLIFLLIMACRMILGQEIYDLFCGSGYYQTSSNSSVCTSCAPGTYASGFGQTVCDLCEEGHYSTSVWAIACIPCEAGTFASVLGTVNCSNCSIGQYQSVSGASTCLNCSEGTYSTGLAFHVCNQCSTGHYVSYQGGLECQECRAGTFASAIGSSECLACAPGTYTANNGSMLCSECETGTYISNTSATACEQCKLCPNYATYDNICSTASTTDTVVCSCMVGFTLDNSMCIPCSVGSFKNESGNQECIACGTGSYASMQGQSVCTSCASSFYSTAVSATNSSVCQECAEGTYSLANFASSCMPCAEGTYNVSSFCYACPVGNYSAWGGNTLCDSCAVGTFAPNEGSSACLQCPAGTYTNTIGSSACNLCPVGTYQIDAGGTFCLSCGTCNASEWTSYICPMGSTADVHECQKPQMCPQGYIMAMNYTTGNTTVLGTNLKCRLSPACKAGQYVSVQSSNNIPQTCSNCTKCLHGYKSYCTPYADSVCIYYSECRESYNIKAYKWMSVHTQYSCAAGQYLSNISNTSFVCLECPVYLLGLNGLWCEPCKGYRQAYLDHSLCVCKPPTVQNEYGQCTCPKGHFLSYEGCLPCLNNTYNEMDIILTDEWWTQQRECTPCPKGTFSGGTSSSCTPCPKYQYRIDEPDCMSCPSGQYTLNQSSSECSQCQEYCMYGQWSEQCPTSTELFVCYDCGSPPNNSVWVNMSVWLIQYTCVFKCNSGYYRGENECIQCSSAVCPPGKMLTPCNAIRDSNCELDCINVTKPMFNSVWISGCNWGCAPDYEAQVINYVSWAQYECVLTGSVPFWTW